MEEKIYSAEGKHVIGDFHKVKNVKLLNNEDKLKDVIKEAIKKASVKLVKIQSHKYIPQGVTVSAIVEESLFAIHTYPEYAYATIDFYTCGSYSKPEVALEYLVKILEPEKVNDLILKRGLIKNLEISPFVRNRKLEPFGYSAQLECYHCVPRRFMNDLDLVYDFLDNLPIKINMEKQAPPNVIRADKTKYPDKEGLSGWVALIESAISIHTIFPKAFMTLDIYSCKNFDSQIIIKEINNIFRPKKISEKFFHRGVEYA